MNKPAIYDAALARWGYDSQVLTLAEESCELGAVATRFVNHKANGSKLAEEAADVEIMIEQLRHNGMGPMIDNKKRQKLQRLANRLACGPRTSRETEQLPDIEEVFGEVSSLIEDAEILFFAAHTDKRRVAASLRAAIARLWIISQTAIRIQQNKERECGNCNDGLRNGCSACANRTEAEK